MPTTLHADDALQQREVGLFSRRQRNSGKSIACGGHRNSPQLLFSALLESSDDLCADLTIAMRRVRGACEPKRICTTLRTMNSTSLSAEEFRQVLRAEVAKITSPRQLAFVESIFIEPYSLQLSWEYGNDEEFVAWVFADLRERDVVAQYCLGGHGRRGCPWGINFRTESNFGRDSGWYPGLKELIEDWGIQE